VSGILVNSFLYNSPGVTVTNTANSGVVTIEFPATGTNPDPGGDTDPGTDPDTNPGTITALDLTALVTAPVAAAAPQGTIAEQTQFTAAIVWKLEDGVTNAPAAFAPGTIYKAIVTITAKTGFTLNGIPTNGFLYNGEGIAATNTANTGVVTIAFPAIYDINTQDFGAGAVIEPVINVANAAEWEAAFAGLQSNKNYIINVTASFSFTEGLRSLTPAPIQNATVSLRGNGHTVSSANFIISGSDDNFINLITRDITLQGSASNTGPVLYLCMGSHFIKSGTIITGGRNGGIVLFPSAQSTSSLTMEDGAITGNTGVTYAGGVLVVRGAFTMTGGTIHGNTAPNAGGVLVVATGTFTKTGGTITGNTATHTNINLISPSYGAGDQVFTNTNTGGKYINTPVTGNITVAGSESSRSTSGEGWETMTWVVRAAQIPAGTVSSGSGYTSRPFTIDLLTELGITENIPTILAALNQVDKVGYKTVVERKSVFKTVEDTVLYSYSNWYAPNTTLSIDLSSINETAVSTTITESLGATAGYADVVSLSASISKEVSTTVTNTRGITVSSSYDLTPYDQSTRYKVVLVGNYTIYRYTFVDTAGATISYFDWLVIDQNSLEVRLVHE
jgi:hypothetical protein